MPRTCLLFVFPYIFSWCFSPQQKEREDGQTASGAGAEQVGRRPTYWQYLGGEGCRPVRLGRLKHLFALCPLAPLCSLWKVAESD